MRLFQKKRTTPKNQNPTSINTGNYYEDFALDYLLSNKLKFVEKNYRCRFGEIDLILLDKRTLVFVEVRFRRQKSFGSALDSIHARKQKRIIKTAEIYLSTKGLTNQVACRFDVVSIDQELSKLKIKWIKNAFLSTD